MGLTIKPKKDCRWDLVSLGEVMLRFDPGDGRIATARTLRSLGRRRRIQRRARPASAASAWTPPSSRRSPITRSAGCSRISSIRAASISRMMQWVADDGVGRTVRNGLNFTERGFGVRAALGCSDRGHTAVSQLKAGESIGTKYLARTARAGSTLAESSARSRKPRPQSRWRPCRQRERHGTIISYDLNYRESLWKSHWRKEARQEVNRRLAALRRRHARQ